MNISRITEGEIPQRYKDAGTALAKRLAAFDKAEASQKMGLTQQVQETQAVQQTQQVQDIQTAQETQRISFAEVLLQVQQAQKAQPVEKPDSAALNLGARAFETLSASETQMARVVLGWK